MFKTCINHALLPLLIKLFSYFFKSCEIFYDKVIGNIFLRTLIGWKYDYTTLMIEKESKKKIIVTICLL